MGVHADFWHVTGDALDYALAVHEIDDPGLKDELMVLYLKLDAYPDAVEALKALVRARASARPSSPMAAPPCSIRRCAPRDWTSCFDMVLSVEDVGIYKPSRRVYRHAMQKLQIQDAPSICFVSANSWDAQAAAQFGFQVGAHRSLSASTDDGMPGKPAALIQSLSESAGDLL